jgi:multisubunit Na+/H+ antiporter MnhC subunit
VALFTGAVWLNVDSLAEAYGDGPPYYGRTTNMDKWSDPVPVLLVLDAVALTLVGVLLAIGLRGVRKP